MFLQHHPHNQQEQAELCIGHLLRVFFLSEAEATNTHKKKTGYFHEILVGWRYRLPIKKKGCDVHAPQWRKKTKCDKYLEPDLAIIDDM